MAKTNTAKKTTSPKTERARKPATARAANVEKKADRSRVVRLLVSENPKRAGTASHKRFALYRDGMTEAAYLAAGGTRGDLAWDVERKFIALEKASK
jgi:hypothetical protein